MPERALAWPIYYLEVRMTYQSLLLNDIIFSFSVRIEPGQRIGVVGRNGSGKTTLLKNIKQRYESLGLTYGYVPQVIEEYDSLSGGQRFQKAFSAALAEYPSILCLDEPTNHLDAHNRCSLMRMLQRFDSTLIIVSHDVELLRTCIDTIWHLEDQHIAVFHGRYDDYIQTRNHKRAFIEKELAQLEKAKKQAHIALMHEQERAKKSRTQGEKSIQNRKWPSIVSAAKAKRAEETSGRKKGHIREEREELIKRLSELRLPEVIKPKFSISASLISAEKPVVSIVEGTCGYTTPILENLNFRLLGRERLAIVGNNGSGKSTLVKAILAEPSVLRTGEWLAPKREEIGYLDQHYQTLHEGKNALDTILSRARHWSIAEARRHLNDFLFRKNDEVTRSIKYLSGGEKVRLSLAQIAAKTPQLLILDEVTNNLDLEAREHVIQVLREYSGALIVISHDEDFLRQIGVENFLAI